MVIEINKLLGFFVMNVQQTVFQFRIRLFLKVQRYKNI
jgi:hypothetical protein